MQFYWNLRILELALLYNQSESSFMYLMEEEDQWDDNNSLNQDLDECWDQVLNYKIYSNSEIQEKQQKIINDAMEIFDFNEDDAITLLKQLRWDSNKLNELNCQNYDVLVKYGIQPKTDLYLKDQELWGICYQELKLKHLNSLKWGHKFCNKWWEWYIVDHISKGYCSKLPTCPQFKCSLIIPHSWYLSYLPKELKNVYKKYHLKSYTDESINLKYCPSPNWEWIIESISGSYITFTWKWENSYCFKCLKIAHRPLNWEDAMKWIAKNASESENMKWILVYTKHWPIWSSPIQKEKGCNHMTWMKWRHEFWWMCKEPWNKHNKETGGYYKWNKYEESRQDPLNQENQLKQERMKSELQKYKWHYERWDNHAKAQSKVKSLQETWLNFSNKLCYDQILTHSQLLFLPSAFEEVIKWREILKWTYAYGYYLDDTYKRELFQWMQEQLEVNWEILHDCLENEFLSFSQRLDDLNFFNNLKIKILSTLESTKKYYENILERLENDTLLEC